MGVVIPSGYAQFTMRWECAGFATGNGATVLGYGGSGAPVANADEFAQNIIDAYVDALQDTQSVLLSLSSVYWQTATQSGEVPAGLTGGRAGDLEMVNTAFLVTYTTGFKGPRARGRSYWPGFLNSADTADNSDITSGRMTSLTTAFNTFYSFLETGSIGSTQVILQRDEPETQKSPPLSPPPEVNSRRYNTRPASQRRRLRR